MPSRRYADSLNEMTMANIYESLLRIRGDCVYAYLDKPLKYGHLKEKRMLTFSDSIEYQNRLANVLIGDMEMKRGDRVVIQKEENIDTVLIISAIIKAGGIAVPIGSNEKAEHVESIIDSCKARFIIFDDENFESCKRKLKRKPFVERCLLLWGNEDCKNEESTVERLMQKASPRFHPYTIKQESVVALFYKENFSDKPQGAMMTSKGLLAFRSQANRLYLHKKGCLGICALFPSDLFGFSAFLMILTAGLTVRLTGYHPERILEAIETERAGFFIGDNQMYREMLEANADAYDLSSVKIWINKERNSPHDLSENFMRLGSLSLGPFNMRSVFVESYGKVELSSLAFARINISIKSRTYQSTWLPLRPLRLKTVDTDWKEIRSKDAGELIVKGSFVFPGFWNNQYSTSTILKDGWLRTGDFVRKGKNKTFQFVEI